jgi:D-alanyl-D-alanine carboxypeptidase
VNDVPQEPEPADRPEDVEREPGRTATAEFRIPAPAAAKNPSTTRTDIRRPAEPAEEAPAAAEGTEPDGEPGPAEEAETPVPQEDEASEETSEQAAPPEAEAADAEESPEESPETADAQEEEPEADTVQAVPEERTERAGAAREADTGREQGPPPAPPEDAEPAQETAQEPSEAREPEAPPAVGTDRRAAAAEEAPEPQDDEAPEAEREEDERQPDTPESTERSAEAAPEPDTGSPAAVTRVERLPVVWEAPEPGSDAAAPAAQGPAAPPRPAGQDWWEAPRQSPGPAAWGTPQQPPAGEFRPESVRWDAAPPSAAPHSAAPHSAAPHNAPPHSTAPHSAGPHGAPPQGAAMPVRPVQSGPWEVAAPQAPAPLPRVDEAEGRPKRRGLTIVLIAALVLVVGVVAGQLVRPVPDPTVKLALASTHVFQGAAPSLPWPAVGQSVVYVDGLGTMGTSGGAAPTPTASVAKVMTAYVYLRDHPLTTGGAGPVLTVSPQGVAEIPARKKRGESLLGITAGQRLTERKALEALLIISANDLAHELARWDSGGDQPFVAKMNAAARELGMTATRYTDPSGYDSGTVSTAADQVKLLRAAMNVPAFTEIVNRRAYVPDDGSPVRPGGNILVGQYGVVGGKTGYTDAAGGNFVFAARKRVGGVPTLILGAVMGQKSPSAMAAVEAGGRLVQAAENAMAAATLAPKGARVGKVDDGLGGTTPLRAASAVTVVGWPGLRVPVGIQGDPPHRGDAGERVGEVTAGAAKVPLVLGSSLDEPSYLKRLVRVN